MQLAQIYILNFHFQQQNHFSSLPFTNLKKKHEEEKLASLQASKQVNNLASKQYKMNDNEQLFICNNKSKNNKMRSV